MKGNTDMVNILNALDFIGNRIGCIKEILSELNFEANKVFLYKSQTEIFIEFIDRFGIVNNLSDELENVALPDLIDEMPTSNSVLIYFMNDFSEPNMLYTYRVTSYPNVEIWKNENSKNYTVIVVDFIPIIDANEPLA